MFHKTNILKHNNYNMKIFSSVNISPITLYTNNTHSPPSGTLPVVVVVVVAYSQLLPFPLNVSCVNTLWRCPLTLPLHCRRLRIGWTMVRTPLGDHAHHGTERVLLLVGGVALESKGAESVIPTIKQ